MSLPTTEIVIGPSSEAYRADPNVLTNGFGPVSKVDGLERYLQIYICSGYIDLSY